MKSISEKYKSPEKCVFAPLKVNLELWKLLSGWQQKSDLLIELMNASLSILSDNFSVQNIA